MDECVTRIHNCVEGSTCINTNGDFRCLCRGQKGQTDCTGMCKRRDVLIEDGGWSIDNCINCTCLVSLGTMYMCKLKENVCVCVCVCVYRLYHVETKPSDITDLYHGALP